MPIVVQQSTNRIVVQEAGARVIRAAGGNRIVANSTAVTIRPHVSRRVVCHEGPRGLPGEPGAGAAALLVEAGEAISAKRPIVVIDDLAYAADSTDPTHNGKVVGISDGAVSQGDDVTVRTDGARLENNTWNWTGGLLYVGAGALTETVPTSGFSQSIAVAVASDALIVQLGPPIGRV